MILVVNLSKPKGAAATIDQIQTYGYVAETTGGSETDTAARRPLDSLAGRLGDWTARRSNRFSEQRIREKLVSAGMYGTTPRKILGYQVIDLLPTYGQSAWSNLTARSSGSYHVLWAPVLLYELLANLALMVLSILLIVLFFQKRASFPWLKIFFMAATVVIQFTDLILVAMIPAAAANLDASSFRDLIRSVSACVVWIPYLCISRRVRSTFVH